MNPIVQTLLASGVSGLVVALVLFVFVVPAVKNSIEHSYRKLLEKTKSDHAIAQKRFEIAAEAVFEMAKLQQEIVETLQCHEFAENGSPLTKLLREVHPTFRAKFRILRSRLEITNDLISYYSLSFDSLLHPESVKELLQSCSSVKSMSDHKYAYRSIWLAVLESMNSLVRTSSSHNFWSPEEPYPERARAWAEHERKLLIKHFVARFNGELPTDAYFALQIESQNGVQRFWAELPSA